ncbi:hypothetical protein K1T71_011970 [Dendrolimus kikuchii]|uniref:Uncharacterized protein n=1 Tax=Dendrolimus kikuchii TaxID=765133 RepID=A0ACC1CMM3_9NEOP|nr:hypothetical protein K1T71_011970 [Dendrolimus kikuchii]
MESGYHRLWTFATTKVLQMRCCSLKGDWNLVTNAGTQHKVCPAWDEQRRDLVAAIGADLSFPALVKAIVGSADAWDAAVSFCETVMSAKEAAEREREQLSNIILSPYF